MIEFVNQTQWVTQLALVSGGILLGLLTERFVVGAFRSLASRTSSTWDDLLIGAVHGMPLVWWTTAGLWAAALRGGLDSTSRQWVTNATMVIVVGSFTLVAMRLGSGLIDRYAARSTARIPSTTLVNNLVKLVIGVLGLLLLLQNLGVEVTPLLTATTLGGLAVALALQDTLSNLFAGVSIILSGQVRTGDYVQLATGEEGFVTDVKARHTTMRTFPALNLVVIPNSVLASSIVTNYSLPQMSLWIEVPVGVSYESDLQEVERVAVEVGEQALEAVEGTPPRMAPVVRYREFGDSSINFDVLLSAGEFADQFLIRHEFIKRLHERFNSEGIEIPFPIRTVHLRGTEPSEG